MKNKNLWQRAAYLVLATLILITSLFASADTAFAQPAAVTCASHYTVKSGDTLSKIASAYGLSLTQLADANNLKSPYTIFVGQSLCIPAGGSGTSSGGTTTTTPSFIVSKAKETLTVQVKNYPKNTGYFIRVKPITGTTWEKVGTLYLDGKGNGKDTITLTSTQLIKAAQLDVCLKNIISGKLYCTKTTESTTTSSAAKLSFTAKVQGSKLIINAKNAPKNNTYYVRVSQEKSGLAGSWNKIGFVKVDSNGNINATFNLPNGYSNWTVLHVCLKNAETDAVVCVKLTR